MSIEIEKDRFWMDTRIGDSRYLGLVRSGFYMLLEFSVSQLTPEDPGLNPRNRPISFNMYLLPLQKEKIKRGQEWTVF